ncbi:MAG TPA: recombinase family protein [Bradyrhizobium sp.]|nr:recombinase family protein [Bradyrhizobium sp.]
MDKPSKKLLRCAIYTRKSTDQNLDLEFNSLDAQREACEAYIKSQAHEGWRLIPDHFDDGAFSGASLDRPALQQLLAELKVGKIDVIVVYKVDRLTRSLSDFAKLVELFDQHSVSFVSVTQSFNTTSSMGRLTLNVLLSFAQFEREVIGERVRDKIAASKAKGIWVGGSIPLGYASVNKKLVVVPEEAETVRLIFRRYLELGSITQLIEDLDRQGVRTRNQKLTSGKSRGNIRFGTGALSWLLRNRLYLGEVVYKGSIYAGEQPPILERELFDAVQTKLAAQATSRQLKIRTSAAILAGRIYDDRGNRMTPTHTNKRGARYRYYVSHALLQKRNKEAGSLARVSAPELEAAVVKAAREYIIAHNGVSPSDERTTIEQAVQRVVVKAKSIEIHLCEASDRDAVDNGQELAAETEHVISLPWSPAVSTASKGVVHERSVVSLMSAEERDVLLTAIAKARSWIDDLAQGRATSFAEIAKREGKVERHIRLLAPLAFVSPHIVANIISGVAASMRVTDLARNVPITWTIRAAPRAAHSGRVQEV